MYKPKFEVVFYAIAQGSNWGQVKVQTALKK